MLMVVGHSCAHFNSRASVEAQLSTFEAMFEADASGIVVPRNAFDRQTEPSPVALGR